jgi:hypothetical protein
MPPSTFTSFSTCAVIAAVTMTTAQPAVAENSAARESRADVRAATLTAARAHLLVPAGEGDLPFSSPVFRSTKTRKQVRTETQQAARDGTLMPAGDGAEWEAERHASTRSSIRSRAEVEAETLAAAKAHQLIPAGEGA